METLVRLLLKVAKETDQPIRNYMLFEIAVAALQPLGLQLNPARPHCPTAAVDLKGIPHALPTVLKGLRAQAGAAPLRPGSWPRRFRPTCSRGEVAALQPARAAAR